MISLAPQLTQRTHAWAAWKVIQYAKSLVCQYEETTAEHTIWGYDGPEVHLCNIWKGEVPHGVLAGGVTQEQNDSDKADFEANFKASANRSIEPRTSDGKAIVLPNLFPGWAGLYHSGAADDPAQGRGAGAIFNLTSSILEDKILEWSFNDGLYLAGGGLVVNSAEIGDWTTLELKCPATPVTANLTNTGNANLVDPGVGAAILIIPVAGNGAFDVDLTKANPVPAYDETSGIPSGFWEWSDPASIGRGTVSPGAPTGSKWNLFSVEIPLARFVNKFPLVGTATSSLTVPSIKPKYILPQWKFKLTLHNKGHIGLQLAWWLTVARAKTT